MSFMVYYCQRHRRAWPISDGARCPEGGKDCEVKSRDLIALVNNLGKELTEAERLVGREGPDK